METDGQHLGFMTGMERVSYIVTDFLVSLFAGKVERAAQSGGVPGHHGLQRVILSGSREERHV